MWIIKVFQTEEKSILDDFIQSFLNDKLQE